MAQIWTAAFLWLTLFGITSSSKYCHLSSCRGKAHTMCLYKKDGPGPECGEDFKGGLTHGEKDLILSEHNKLRSEIANGQIEGFPEAADMAEMRWSSELAKIAQRWVDQCTFEHDKCRNTDDYAVGQNLAWYATSGRVKRKSILKSQIRDWFDEKKNCPESQIRKFTMRGSGGEIGHFTQLVWASSVDLGCGLAQSRKDGFTELLLACNYGPAGNWIGRQVYKEGTPCDSCNGECTNGLCRPGDE